MICYHPIFSEVVDWDKKTFWYNASKLAIDLQSRRHASQLFSIPSHLIIEADRFGGRGGHVSSIPVQQTTSPPKHYSIIYPLLSLVWQVSQSSGFGQHRRAEG